MEVYTKPAEEFLCNVLQQINAKLKEKDQATILFGSVVGARLMYNFHDWLYHDDVSARVRLRNGFFAFLRSLPILKTKINDAVEESKASIDSRCTVKDQFMTVIDEKPKSFDEIVNIMKKYINYDTINWRAGSISGTTFTDDPELTKLCAFTYKEFMLCNPLHPDVHCSLRKMEAEVIQMVLNMYKAPPQGCGIMTTGGTESLGLAVLAARNRALERGIKWPELVMGHTAHSGIDKAAHYFRVKVIKVGYQSDYRANMREFRRAINSNTCLLVGSAPNFPHGILDDLEAISDLAVKYDIPFHVDACMGGFLLPFVKEAGHKIEPFDFTLPGVTSISADCHKYGYCPKGASTVLFRSPELRRYAIFTATEWPGGIYATPSYSGSRAGGHIAACWATMNKVGRSGYVERTRKVIDTCIRIREAVKTINGLNLIGDPKLCICAFNSDVFNIYQLLSDMRKRGWTLGVLQMPPAIHMDVTEFTTRPGVCDNLLKDLRDCADNLMKQGASVAPDSSAAFYGLASKVPDRRIVAELASYFIECNIDIKRK